MPGQTLTEEGLVQSVLRGDEDAFSLFYERYRQSIYSAAYRIIQHREDAQDATQEIAFKLYRSLHRWDVQKSKLSTWIYAIAANHSIDCCRMRRRRRESPLSDPDNDFTIPDRSARSPFKEVESREYVSAILRCTETLPDPQRQIFTRRYFHQSKLEEIAEIERCSLGTVKSSLHRATRTIRRLLQKAESSPS
jgi:RNA polymerase sigma factor (sigma-70 family)